MDTGLHLRASINAPQLRHAPLQLVHRQNVSGWDCVNIRNIEGPTVKGKPNIPPPRWSVTHRLCISPASLLMAAFHVKQYYFKVKFDIKATLSWGWYAVWRCIDSFLAHVGLQQHLCELKGSFCVSFDTDTLTHREKVHKEVSDPTWKTFRPQV